MLRARCHLGCYNTSWSLVVVVVVAAGAAAVAVVHKMATVVFAATELGSGGPANRLGFRPFWLERERGSIMI